MKTANELIADAYLQTGMIPQESGLRISPYLTAQGLMLLNDIIAEWGGISANIPYSQVVAFDFVANQESYTFGIGGEYDVDTAPIIDVISASYYINPTSNNIKYTLEQINEDQYANILYTGVSNYPSQFLIRIFPNYTEIKFQPLPQSNYPCKLVCKQRLQQVDLNQNLEEEFPSGFLLALKYRLMLDIADANGFDLSQSFIAKAERTLASMKGNNKMDLSIRKGESLGNNRRGYYYTAYWTT